MTCSIRTLLIAGIAVCAPAAVLMAMESWARPSETDAQTIRYAAQNVPTVTVMHWMSSTGEERALDVVRRAYVADGGRWTEDPLPDVASEQSVATDRILGGKAPEIFQFSVGSRLRGLASQGLVATVPVNGSTLSSMIPPLVATAARYDRRYVALPFDIMGENWMFYNVKVLQEYGLQVPRTWSQFAVVAAELKKHHMTPVALGGEPWQERILFNDVLLGVGGPGFYKRVYGLRDRRALLSPTMLKVFLIFGQLRSDVDPNSPGRSWIRSTVLLEQQKAAFEFMGDWAKSQIQSAGFVLGSDIGCALAPSHDTAYIMAADAFAFSRANSQSALAGQRLFSRVLLSKSVQINFNKLRGSIPVRSDLPTKGFDVCAKRAMEVIRDRNRQLVSIGLFGLSGGLAGAVEDAVSEYWNDPRMTAGQGVTLFSNAFGTFQ